MPPENPASHWDAQPGWLNTASYGLPPRVAFEAVQATMADWRIGRTSWEGWDSGTGRARAAFARLVGVPVDDVAVAAQVSQLLAPIAAAVPDGAHVLSTDVEFTSALFPWLVHADRGVQVRTVPVDALLDEVRAGVDVVAFSHVQSATGQVAPLVEIAAAARRTGAMVVVDATQSCGWLPVAAELTDAVVVSAYKWLMAPRGAALAYLSPRLQRLCRPLAAGWYAGEHVHESYYGPPLRLARSARRFDVSPAWFSWVGAAPALELVEQLGVATIGAHNVGLANRFLAGLNRAPGDSAIVTIDAPGAEQRLADAGIRAAVRAGRVRASFHIYTTESDVDTAVTALLREPVPAGTRLN